MRKITRTAILCVAIGSLFITGCTSFFTFRTPSSAAPSKGETVSITGSLEKDKNQYLLTDTRSGISYRLVGLKKAEEAQLSPWVGKTVTVKLVVKSTESAKAYIAQFVAIAK